MTEGIDVEVENAAIDEVAFVQVKSTAGPSVLDDYVTRFMAQRKRYSRMIFAVHSPTGPLTAPPNIPVQVWDGVRIADLVVRFDSATGWRSGSEAASRALALPAAPGGQTAPGGAGAIRPSSAPA